MKINTLSFILVVLFSCVTCSTANSDHFVECLHNFPSVSNQTYDTNNISFTKILQFSIQNLRFTSGSTPKPKVIITPTLESQIPPIIYCAKKTKIQIRTRSGGHDYEALSYVSGVAFVVVDLINLKKVTVNAFDKSAWVEAGATLGSVYYEIAQKSPVLGFPAGVCPTVGVGGHVSGGGYGMLLRKYGLAADHVIDARIVDVRGRILDRRSMGEDLFWAIRGGGGASFGVIVAWKLQLVDVPKKVTVFSVKRTTEQNLTRLVHQWQHVAPRFENDLFVRVILTRGDTMRTINGFFNSVFLGRINRLLPMVKNMFPELGLQREDCMEMSWIQSVLSIAGLPSDSPRVLLNRTQSIVPHFKAKSDYVQSPIPEKGLEGIWRLFYEPEAEKSFIIFSPFGGKMDEIPDSAIPFPHRASNLYQIQYLVYWQANQVEHTDRYISWIRKLYSYMAKYVSYNPRAAYLNYRDLDIGANNPKGKTSYAQANIWGRKYFKGNFDRLVRVKTIVDPENFFRNEQSIPPITKDGLFL